MFSTLSDFQEVCYVDWNENNRLFTLPDSDSDTYSDSDSCTMQKFHIGSDPDSGLLIEMYVIGTEICP